MVSIFQKLKRKIITLRGEQREKQHKLDAEDESTRRWYCDICQLQYKQPKSTHYSSYYHKVRIQTRFELFKISDINSKILHTKY